jgi:TIR domain
MIAVTLRPAPELVADRDAVRRLELHNTGRIACLNLVVEFAVHRPLVLVQGDRRITVDRLGPGRRHAHEIRLRGTSAGRGGIVLRTFSYRDVRGRVTDAGGTTLAVAIAPSPPDGCPPEPVSGGSSHPGSHNEVASVFVSHRSTDSAWFVHLLVDHLRRTLQPHRVFVDTDLRGGQIWPDRLDTELRGCAAVVALIGPTWSSASAVLHGEIRTALAEGIFLLPVLFDGARSPCRADLPPDIAGLADRHAITVEPGHVRDDLMRIEMQIRHALSMRSRGADGEERGDHPL